MSDTPTPGVYFHSDALEGAGKDLVGRRSAGESFLKGWLRCVGRESLTFVVDNQASEAECRKRLEEMGETRPVTIHRLQGAPHFTQAGTIFFPAPGYMKAPWLRLRADPADCSLVGLTHTVSTMRVMEAFHTLLAEPVEDWDAIICTSRAVQSVVARQMREEEAFYRQRFAAGRVPMPRLPVIPLGIETADFAPMPGARERLRERFGVEENGVAVMTMGRLSVIEKANLIPLFLSLDSPAMPPEVPIHLWLVGWSSRKEEEELVAEIAQKLRRRMTVRVIDGRDPDIRRNIWAAADIFTLPADSIQETFGLVPVEAMAAGLPVVMPDWDGFRDTVVHGETGILVKTRMAETGVGGHLAARHFDGSDGYLQYLVQAQAGVQIDMPLYCAALLALVRDPALRKRMGAAAMRHAQARLDWSAVVPQYLSLADELAEVRRAARGGARPQPIRPLELDPYELYAGYPTSHVGPETRVAARSLPRPELIALFDKLSGRNFAKRGLLNPEVAIRVCRVVMEGADTPARIAAEIGVEVRVAVLLVLHLAKVDILWFPEGDPPL